MTHEDAEGTNHRQESRHPSRQTYFAPLRLFAIIAATVFIGEFLVMLVLAVLPETPTVVEALVDGVMITLFVTPALILFLIRPMARNISRRETAEDQLRTLNRELEDRVAERTTELTAAIEQLKREVAGRKHAEMGLSKSADFIEAVLRSAPCILAIYDVNSLACSFVNEGVADFLGYSPDDALVKGEGFFKEIFSPEDFTSFSNLNARLASGLDNEILQCECQLRNIEGELRSFGFGIVSVKDSPTKPPKNVLLAALPTGVGWPDTAPAHSNDRD